MTHYSVMVKITPEQFIEADGSIEEALKTKLAPFDFKYITNWTGYEYEPGRGYGHMSNPKAKWDWWVLGGRYHCSSSGLLHTCSHRAHTNAAASELPGEHV